MDGKEIGCDVMSWIHPFQGRNQWPTFVNTLMNCLTRWTTIDFWRWSLLRAVSGYCRTMSIILAFAKKDIENHDFGSLWILSTSISHEQQAGCFCRMLFLILKLTIDSWVHFDEKKYSVQLFVASVSLGLPFFLYLCTAVTHCITHFFLAFHPRRDSCR